MIGLKYHYSYIYYYFVITSSCIDKPGNWAWFEEQWSVVLYFNVRRCLLSTD